MTKKLISNLKEKRYNEYVLKHDQFCKAWNKRNNEIRVEIHINSLGFDRFQRNTTCNYMSNQNAQISRIFRLIDPTIEIIYVSPFKIPLEILSYYIKMMDLIGIENVAERFHIVIPENYELRIEEANADTLILWLRRTIASQSIHEIFKD